MNIRKLSKSLQEKAERELNEMPNQNPEIVKNLREWLGKQEHIRCKNDDQLLINFLRGSKFSLHRAKEKIDAYYSFRTAAPELSQNIDPFEPAIQAYLRQGMCIPLPIPKEDPASPRVFLLRYHDYDPDEITLTTALRAGTLFLSIFLNDDDNFVVSGATVIWDLKGLHLKTALQTTPDLIKKGVYCYDNAYPCRLKALYIINIPIFFESVINMVKLLFPKKMTDRLHFYSTNNMERIYSAIPLSILPKEYGGQAGPHAELAAEWKKVVESHRERLLTENNYCTDESKRPCDSKTGGSLFGIDGSFKKLEID